MNSTPSARVSQVSADAKAAAPAPAAYGVQDDSVAASELAIAELQRLLGLWLAHEPGARLGDDPEELHQLRVTARRIDATLGLFKRQLPPTLVRARRATKVVLRTLGTARDLDVQLSVLQRYCARLPEKERTAAEPLREHLEAERERARRRMLRGLDSEPTRRWLQTLTAAREESAEQLRGGQCGNGAGCARRQALSQAAQIGRATAPALLDGRLSRGTATRQAAALCHRVRQRHAGETCR